MYTPMTIEELLEAKEGENIQFNEAKQLNAAVFLRTVVEGKSVIS